MSSPELFLRQQLIALRAGIVAQLAQVDATLALLGDAAPEQPPAPASSECRHTRRLSATTMGHPTAWVCATPGCSAGGED